MAADDGEVTGNCRSRFWVLGGGRGRYFFLGWAGLRRFWGKINLAARPWCPSGRCRMLWGMSAFFPAFAAFGPARPLQSYWAEMYSSKPPAEGSPLTPPSFYDVTDRRDEVGKGRFTFMDGSSCGTGDCWICHDPSGSFAGEFKAYREAATACHRWQTKGGDQVTVVWHKPENEGDAYYNRGVYTVQIGDWKMRESGTHGMEHAARIAQRVRDFVAEYGVKAAVAAAKAFSER